MLFSLVLLFELLEIIVLTMKKLFPLFSPYTSVFGSIVVYPRFSEKPSYSEFFSLISIICSFRSLFGFQ